MKPQTKLGNVNKLIAGILLVVFLYGLFFVSSASAAAGVYDKINFQGKLVNNNGTNVTNGSYTIRFDLYDAATVGSSVWNETQSVTVTDGIFRVELGSVTPFGATVFDNDNLYLNIQINGGADLSPRIRFTAAPYAMNAKKVNGLNVTNTTGTLTIPNGATIAFSGANSLTFTTSGTTSLTLPSGTDQLVARTSTDTLTNKTIGSTGLVFSGASTDIDSAAAEGITIQGRAASAFNTTSGNLSFQVAGSGTTAVLQLGAGGAGSTTPDYLGLDVKSTTGDPGSGAEGYMYYNTFDNKFRCFQGSSWVDCVGAGVFTSSSGIITATTGTERLQLNIGETGDTGLEINGIAAQTANYFQIDATSADANPIIAVDSTGKIQFGAGGSTAVDTNLYRSGVGKLKTDNQFIANNGVQVGSATNRANAEVYGNIVSKGMTYKQVLANINDIYIYDATHDTDGGNWTNSVNSQQLSWYTETKDDAAAACNISTMDRCGSSVFPKKAVIMTTNDALYIFDNTDYSLWMKFTQVGGTFAMGADTNNNPSGIFALNGVVYVGTNGSSGSGLYAFDFTRDIGYNYDATDRSQGDTSLANRNTATTYATNNQTNFSIGNSIVNDVHGAIQLGSSSTGPVNGTMLIGVANDNGAYLINLSNQSVIGYSDVTGDDYNAIYVTKRGRMYALNETQAQAEEWRNIDIDVATRLNGTPDKLWDQASTPALSRTTPTISALAPDALDVIERGSLADETSDIIYVGTNQGLTEIHDHATVGMGWSKFYDTAQRTSLMPATIRGMFLFNETTGNLSDSSFRANVLKPQVAPTYSVEGVHGKALTFNGTSQFLCNDSNADATCDTDTDYNVNNGGFTIQMWFRHSVTAPSAAQSLVDRTSTGGANVGGYRLYMNTTGTLQFGVDDDNATFPEVSATTTQTYLDNQWHHVVATRNFSSTAAQNILMIFVDGKQVATSGVLTGTNTSLETGGTGILAIGATCSTANCAAAVANSFWNGSIDDFSFSAGGTASSTTDNILQIGARRLYSDAIPALKAKAIAVTDATTFTSTTIGDSGETWIPNEFTGRIVAITGGTGINQTRYITSNTATVLTVSPPFTTTPDATSDFQINPEVLNGTSNVVTAVQSDSTVALGNTRPLYVGTNSGTDTGGVSVLSGNLVSEVYHSDTARVDDYSATWNGTDYDDIQAIDAQQGVVIYGSLAHFWAEKEERSLRNATNELEYDLNVIKGDLLARTLSGSAIENGQIGGADLAEYYHATETVNAGMIVTSVASVEAGIKPADKPYQRDILGVVATNPGLILGPQELDSYPVALVGRVPVRVTNENGMIRPGDRVTSSSLAGFGMRATKAGRVVGTAITALNAEDLQTCPNYESNGLMCGTITVFVNLSDYLGDPTSIPTTSNSGVLAGPIKTSSDSAMAFFPEGEQQTLAFLKEQNDSRQASGSAYTTGVYADQVVALNITADTIYANKIKANQIEGLQIYVDKLSNLSDELARVKAEQDKINAQKSDVLGSATDSAGLIPITATDSATFAPIGIVTLDGLQVNSSATISANLNVGGNTLVEGILNVIEAVTTRNLVVEDWASFIGKVIFKDNVYFTGRPTFNKDTAGYVTVKKGERKATITFVEEYTSTPIVVASFAFDKVEDTAKQDLLIAYLLNSDIQYAITDKSTKSFTVELNKAAGEDVVFSWVALAVSDAKIDPKSIASPAPTPLPISTSGGLNITAMPTPTPLVINEDTTPRLSPLPSPTLMIIPVATYTPMPVLQE